MTARRQRYTSGQLAACTLSASPDADGRAHRYFMRWECPRPPWGGRAPLGRALFVFLCPAEGPQNDADMARLAQHMTGRGVGEIGVAYLFTAEGCDGLDAWRDPANVGPLARSALRAGLRWVERPGVARTQSGRVILGHGRPWKTGHAGEVLAARMADLWADLRAFKRRANGFSSPTERTWPVNPLDERAVASLELQFLHPSDGGPQPEAVPLAWWTLPRQ